MTGLTSSQWVTVASASGTKLSGVSQASVGSGTGKSMHDGTDTHLILLPFFLPLQVVEFAAVQAELVSGQQPGQTVQLLERGGVDGGVNLQQGRDGGHMAVMVSMGWNVGLHPSSVHNIWNPELRYCVVMAMAR